MRWNRNMWLNFMKMRYYRNGISIAYYRSSSVWGGIRKGLELIRLDVKWSIGTNSQLSLWNDVWLNGRSLWSFLHRLPELGFTADCKVSNFISDNAWALPDIFFTLFPVVLKKFRKFTSRMRKQMKFFNGMITVKEAFNTYRSENQVCIWKKAICLFGRCWTARLQLICYYGSGDCSLLYCVMAVLSGLRNRSIICYFTVTMRKMHGAGYLKFWMSISHCWQRWLTW